MRGRPKRNRDRGEAGAEFNDKGNTMAKTKEVSKVFKAARKSLGLNGEGQQAILRKVRRALGLTNQELAKALGVEIDTLYAYLSPSTAKKFRKLPAEARLTLEKILADAKRK